MAEQVVASTTGERMASELETLLAESRAQQARIRDALTRVLSVLDGRDSPR